MKNFKLSFPLSSSSSAVNIKISRPLGFFIFFRQLISVKFFSKLIILVGNFSTEPRENKFANFSLFQQANELKKVGAATMPYQIVFSPTSVFFKLRFEFLVIWLPRVRHQRCLCFYSGSYKISFGAKESSVCRKFRFRIHCLFSIGWTAMNDYAFVF